MSVVLQAVVPNGFTDLDSKENAMKELMRVLAQLKRYLHSTKGFDLDVADYDGTEFECNNSYAVELPFCFMEVAIGNGFLLIDAPFRHSAYFYIDEESDDGAMYWREFIFDVVSALGHERAIVASDDFGRNRAYKNGKEFGDHDFTYYDYLSEFGEIPEIKPSSFHKFSAPSWPEVEDIGWDGFADCRRRKEALQRQFPDFKIITLCRICGRFVLATKDDALTLLDLRTRKPLEVGAIDGFNARFNGAGFTLYKGDSQAFFNREGVRITPYGVRNFDWRWLPGKLDDIEIYDRKTGERVWIASF